MWKPRSSRRLDQPPSWHFDAHGHAGWLASGSLHERVSKRRNLRRPMLHGDFSKDCAVRIQDAGLVRDRRPVDSHQQPVRHVHQTSPWFPARPSATSPLYRRSRRDSPLDVRSTLSPGRGSPPGDSKRRGQSWRSREDGRQLETSTTEKLSPQRLGRVQGQELGSTPPWPVPCTGFRSRNPRGSRGSNFTEG